MLLSESHPTHDKTPVNTFGVRLSFIVGKVSDPNLSNNWWWLEQPRGVVLFKYRLYNLFVPSNKVITENAKFYSMKNILQHFHT